MSLISDFQQEVKTPSSMQGVALRYAGGLVFVLAAVVLSLVLEPFLSNAYLVLFLAAVMAAGWFCRTGFGLFSVGVSILAIDYFFIPPQAAFAIDAEEMPYFFSVLLSAVGATWLASTRRRSEETQKAHLDELFEQAPEAIMLLDSQDHVLRINKEFSRIFRYTPEEAVGRIGTALIVPDAIRHEAIASQERLASGQHITMETVRRTKDGTLLEVSEVAVPIIVAGQRISYYVIFRDITDRKRATEALQKAQTELAHLSRLTTMGELVASIAHEVNQPIAAVVTTGNAAGRWLAQQPPNLAEVDAALKSIVEDANRASAVIGRIRSLVSKSVPQMVWLDINDVIRDVLGLAADEIRRGGIILKTELADLHCLLGDRVQLQQVLLNLIINGIDATNMITGRPRELCIKSSQEGDCLVVEVRDSGSGFDPKLSESLFDPFFTTKDNGLGMGLTISRSIIEVHGGRLWAMRSEPHGAVFKFTLPTGDAE